MPRLKPDTEISSSNKIGATHSSGGLAVNEEEYFQMNDILMMKFV